MLSLPFLRSIPSFSPHLPSSSLLHPLYTSFPNDHQSVHTHFLFIHTHIHKHTNTHIHKHTYIHKQTHTHPHMTLLSSFSNYPAILTRKKKCRGFVGRAAPSPPTIQAGHFGGWACNLPNSLCHRPAALLVFLPPPLT